MKEDILRSFMTFLRTKSNVAIDGNSQDLIDEFMMQCLDEDLANQASEY